jgi:hypothetical protein
MEEMHINRATIDGSVIEAEDFQVQHDIIEQAEELHQPVGLQSQMAIQVRRDEQI